LEEFDPVHVESINSPALYGVGLIYEMSSVSVKTGYKIRTVAGIGNDFNLDFDAVRPGRLRTHGFGLVGRFGWKGQFATLEQFVAAACAVELGLTNSQRA